MQTITQEQSIPDLVQTAWRTEGRFRELEVSAGPTMVDVRDVRIKVDEIAAELHDTKLQVLAVARQQNTILMEVGRQGLAQGHMQAELHGVMNDQREMKVTLSEMKVILNLLVDHFGLVIPAPEAGPVKAAEG